MTDFICPFCGSPTKVVRKVDKLGFILHCSTCNSSCYARETAELGKYYLEDFNPSRR